jgi:uncharacterized protein YndB with AHSA1/START domain
LSSRSLLRFVLAAVCGFCCAAPAGPSTAEVVDAADGGFTVRTVVTVSAPPAEVYDAVVNSVGRWWHPDHTWSGDPRNMSIDDRPGGCFCEKLPGGGHCRHMDVVYADRGQRLRLRGGLGPLQAMALTGSLSWDFASAGEGDAGTQLTLTYAAVGYQPGGFQQLAPIVDGVLAQQIGRLKSFVETGQPE